MATPAEYRKFIEWGKTFKERVWRKQDGQSGYVVPLTDETLSHLRFENKEGQDYQFTEHARMSVQYLELVATVQDIKSEKRWDFLFSGKGTEFNYPSPLPPMMHQRVGVEAALGMEVFADLQEMGTGKTKQIIDEVLIYEMKHSDIQHVLIVCPKSLRFNWGDEIRLNMPDIFHYHIEYLNGPQSVLDLMRNPAHIKFLISTYDGMVNYLQVLKVFSPTLCALDEAHYIKTPTSQRTKAAFELSTECKRRRILTGTYCANTIMDLWAPCQFLRFGILGYATYGGFKSAFAKVRNIIDPITKQPTPFDKIVGYKDVDRLKENLSRFSFIVRKDQCMDLPERSYKVVSVEMPAEMRRVYDEFEEKMMVQLEGMTLKTEFRLTQYMRLGQFCTGHVGTSSVELDLVQKQVTHINGGDTKAKQLVEDLLLIVQECKAIVWGNYDPEIDMLSRLMTEAGIKHVLFDGRVSEKQRNLNKNAFNNDPEVRVFLGKPSAGGVGLNLIGDQRDTYTSCLAMLFHSNRDRFDFRDQAEARNHRKGSKHPVVYIDYAYEDSADMDILNNLRNKADVQSMMKDLGPLRERLLARKSNHDT